MKILIVHGIGNYRASVEPAEASLLLRDSWLQSLREGAATTRDDLNISLSVAYYAHILRASDSRQAGPDTVLTDDELDLFLSWADAYGVPIQKAQGPGTMPVRQVLSWVAGRGGAATEAVTSLVLRFIREVNEYFTVDEKRHRVRELVETEIRSQRPDLVIAHSLGSVVAYEALWNSDVPVPRLLTVGSPLGLRGGIFDRVMPGPVGGRGNKPDCVEQWVNVADRGDIVAIPRFLSDSYSGISGDHETYIGRFAFHALGSYLSSADVGALIHFGGAGRD
ncbi:hypothetical protein ACFVYG_12615 [Streptomyces sp. NPDC058256]|uniref:hypothetical protein n=1 Tax=Streptomyces sp. NPDC058256 TaxID=3346408 RepID=UPI0036E05B8F